MKRLLFLLLFAPLFLLAQDEKGIQWTTGLSWEQVKAKAKQENKYIFLDCYTTWCAPCKMMDKNVYANDSVGYYFNNKFISVRVQIDQTKNDDIGIKNWYRDAEAISKEYKLEAFPTFVFLSPQGIVAERQQGYTGPKDFIALAENAMMPGKVYNDPYKNYERLLGEFKRGNIRYDNLAFMIDMSSKLKDSATKSQLLNAHVEYVSSLRPEGRYTKENISFWYSLNLRNTSKLFQYFLNDGQEIDGVMNRKGFALSVVDKTIQNEIVIPFFKEQNTNPAIAMTGMYKSGAGIKPDYSEADWKKLQKEIRQKTNNKIAKRSVLTARIEWYIRHWNINAASKHELIKHKKYPPDLGGQDAVVVNSKAWNAFMYVTDKNILNGHIKWQKKLIDYWKNDSSKGKGVLYYFMDTYANLLYKVGNTEEAIKWEEMAMNAAKSEGDIGHFQTYQFVANQMKKGQPTYNLTPLVSKN